MVGEKTKKHLKEVKYKQKYVVLKENNRPQKYKTKCNIRWFKCTIFLNLCDLYVLELNFELNKDRKIGFVSFFPPFRVLNHYK